MVEDIIDPHEELLDELGIGVEKTEEPSPDTDLDTNEDEDSDESDSGAEPARIRSILSSRK